MKGARTDLSIHDPAERGVHVGRACVRNERLRAVWKDILDIDRIQRARHARRRQRRAPLRRGRDAKRDAT
jgi:hypothetical protein